MKVDSECFRLKPRIAIKALWTVYTNPLCCQKADNTRKTVIRFKLFQSMGS